MVWTTTTCQTQSATEIMCWGTMSCTGVLCHVVGYYVMCWGTMSCAGVLCHMLGYYVTCWGAMSPAGRAIFTYSRESFGFSNWRECVTLVSTLNTITFPEFPEWWMRHYEGAKLQIITKGDSIHYHAHASERLATIRRNEDCGIWETEWSLVW